MDGEDGPQTCTVVVRAEDGIFGLVPVTLLPAHWPLPDVSANEQILTRISRTAEDAITVGYLWKHTLVVEGDQNAPHLARSFTPDDVSSTQFIQSTTRGPWWLSEASGRTVDRALLNNLLYETRRILNGENALLTSDTVYATKIVDNDYELEFAWVEENNKVWCGMSRTYTRVPLWLLMLEMGTLWWPPADTRLACTLRLRCRLLFRGSPVKSRETDFVRLLVFRTEVLDSVAVTGETFRERLKRALAPAARAVPAACFRVMFLRPSWLSDVLATDADGTIAVQPLFTNNHDDRGRRQEILRAHRKMGMLGYTAYRDFATLTDACQYLQKSHQLQTSLDCIVAYMIDGSVFSLENYANNDGDGEQVPMLYVHCQDITLLSNGRTAPRVTLDADPTRTLLECLQDRVPRFQNRHRYAVARSTNDLHSSLSQVSLLDALDDYAREMPCTPTECVIVSLTEVPVTDGSVKSWEQFTREFAGGEMDGHGRRFCCIEGIIQVAVVGPPPTAELVAGLFDRDLEAGAVALCVPSLPRTLLDAQRIQPVQLVTNDGTWADAAARYVRSFDLDTRAPAIEYSVSAAVVFSARDPYAPNDWRLEEAGQVTLDRLLVSALAAPATNIVRERTKALDALCELRGESLLDWTARMLNHLRSLGDDAARLDQTPKKALGSLFSRLHQVAHVSLHTSYETAGTRLARAPPDALPSVLRAPPVVDMTTEKAVQDYAHDDAGRTLLAAVIARWDMVQRMARACTAYGADILERGTILQCIEWTRQRENSGLLPREGFDPALLYIRPRVLLAPLDVRLFLEDAIPAGRPPFSREALSFTPGYVLRQWMLGGHPERLVRYRSAVVDWDHATRTWYHDNLSTKASEGALFEKYFRALEVLNATGDVGNVDRAMQSASDQFHRREQTLADLTQIRLPGAITRCILNVPILTMTAQVLLTAVTQGTRFSLHLLHRLQCPPDRSPYCAVLWYYEHVRARGGPEPPAHRAMFHSTTLARTSVFYAVAWWLTVYCEPVLRATASRAEMPATLPNSEEHARASLPRAYAFWRAQALRAVRQPYDPYTCVALPAGGVHPDSVHDRYLCAMGRMLRGLFREDSPSAIENWEEIRQVIFMPSDEFDPSSAVDFEDVSPILWLHAFTSVFDLQATVHVTTVSSAAFRSDTLGEPDSTTIVELGHGAPHDLCPMMHLELRMGSVARPLLLVPGVSSMQCRLHMFLPGERDGAIVFDENGAPFALDSRTREVWHAAVTAANVAFVNNEPDVLEEENLPVVAREPLPHRHNVYGPRGAERLWTPIV